MADNIETSETAPITNPTVDAQGRPTTGTVAKPTRGPMDFDALGAKAYQALTFGFGADIDKAIFGKQAQDTTRQLVKDYDHDNPMASFGIDLAASVVQAAALPNIAAKGVAGAVGRLATGGAGIGAVQGAGQGGDLSERAGNAVKGAVVGGVLGGAAQYAGKVAQPMLEKAGVLDAGKGAFNRVQAALKSEGKTMEDMANFLKANPNARMVDFSPKIAEAVGQAANLSNKTSRQMGDVARQDTSEQAGRIGGEVSDVQPLAKVQQSMIDDLGALQSKRQAAYTAAKTEAAAVTPELRDALSHPEVQPLLKKAVEDFNAGKLAGVSDLQGAPKVKIKAGELSSLPSAVLDDLQKSVGRAAQEEGPGSTRYGTLTALQRTLKDQQTGSVKEGQQLAARIGGEATGTGILGAQEFGHGFAFGLKKADMEVWHKIKGDPEMVQYARLGMTNGLNDYLIHAGKLPEGTLSKIAGQLRSPEVEEVLGKKGANDVRKVFEKEAARQRVNAQIEKGGNRQAAFHEENESRMASHAANVVGGLGHIGGTAVRMLMGTGMSEKQAQSLIATAARPGGIEYLKRQGASRKVLDTLYTIRGQVAGAAGASADIKGRR